MPGLASLPPIVLVMLGGAVGSALHYPVGRWALAMLGPGLAFGTWTVAYAVSSMADGVLARYAGLAVVRAA